VYGQLAEVLYINGKHGENLRLLDSALALRTITAQERAAFHLGRAVSFFAMKNAVGVLTEADAVLAIDPTNEQALGLRDSVRRILASQSRAGQK
jgi:hypothetical protein